MLPLVAILRAKFRLPRKTFSPLTGFFEWVIADGENGKAMSHQGQRRVIEIERLRDLLAQVIKPEVIPR
ncbi:hypothetical protein [Frigoriglobus tundricola]|uniref:hypothetical protein n=1 Tax=Frigoriglobus tundricola TaxID=2774151 RepID=UPI00148EB7B2|nr:hypothetical protein [Frigoriglobus tundricola]